MSLLKVNRLMVTGGEDIALVDNVSFTLEAGEMLGLVGESGSGKTVTCRALMRLLPGDGLRISGGEVVLDGRDILPLSEGQMSAVRGREIGMIFQNPTSHLNPVMTIGEQIAESRRLHFAANRRQAREDALALLRQVGIPDPQNRLNSYPHEFSGGMRQRVMIAMALLCRPKLLIADEPTTALDVTVQAQIMTLLNELKREFNTAIIMITHDLGVVAGICDKVLVMYAGRTMEYGQARDVFYQPSHPYSIGLLNAVPRLDAEGDALLTIPGNPPNLLRLPKGCPFQPRCPHAMEICNSAPPLEEFAPGRLRACFQPVGDLL